MSKVDMNCKCGGYGAYVRIKDGAEQYACHKSFSCYNVAEAPRPEDSLGSGEFTGCMESVTREMLNAAMKKAVELELIPKHAGEELYLKNWNGMRQVIEAALRMR